MSGDVGMLEADDIMHDKVKRSMKKKYIRRVKKRLSSKLNASNIIKAINSWAVSLLRYSGGIVNWTKSELAELDRKTRKLLTIHCALHLRSNVSRLYLPRREGGRGLISVEDAINIEERNINVYISQSQERLLKAAWERKNVDEIETPKEYKERIKRKRIEDWSGKQLHGQFKRETEDLSGVSCNWIRTSELKKETGGLIFAAQDQALRTNAIKARIENQNVSSKCRMCGSHDETVQHILCSCPKFAQTEYKKRHDVVGRVIHWELFKEYGVECSDKWYEHSAKSIDENEEVKLLWDFTIQTDREIHHRRPDIVIQKKKAKETEKYEKYQDLASEIKRIWKSRTKVVPVVVGALGSVSKNLAGHLEQLGIKDRTRTMQKSALFGSAHSLRKVLEV